MSASIGFAAGTYSLPGSASFLTCKKAPPSSHARGRRLLESTGGDTVTAPGLLAQGDSDLAEKALSTGAMSGGVGPGRSLVFVFDYDGDVDDYPIGQEIGQIF